MLQSEMQTLLSDRATGTPVYDSSGAQVGVMPDLRRLLKAAGLVPDVYLRDDIGDSGAVPSARAVGASPDVIVVDQPVGNPNTAFGQGSGQEDNANLSSSLVAGQPGYVYVRLRNRGGSTALGTTATVYWSEPATLVVPANWQLIGTTAALDVPKGDVPWVTQALLWPAAPPSGHYCCIAELHTPTDPRPPHPPANDWQAFLDYVRDRNNVAWRNINVIPAGDPTQPSQFFIVGAPDGRRHFNFEVIQRLPDGVRVMLTVPRILAKQFARDGWLVKRRGEDDRLTVFLPPAPRLRLAHVLLEAGARHRSTFEVEVAKGARLDGNGVTIRQLFGDVEVGQLSWRFHRVRPRRRPRV